MRREGGSLLREKKALRTWQVQREERLGSFVQRQLPFWSGRAIKRHLELNHCAVNGQIERFVSRTLRAGDEVRFDVNKVAAEAPGRGEPEVIYLDEALLVLNKPPQWTCQAAEVEALEAIHGPLGWVHRLDRDTTGVLLLARTPAVQKNLEKLFAERAILKQYLALVDGVPKTMTGSCRQSLRKRSWFSGQQLWGIASEGEGCEAHTDWQVLAHGEDVALLQCFPKTGRTHQLRVHLSSMGHPILGDRAYAKRFRSQQIPRRVMLHAQRIECPHPCSGEPFVVEAPLPRDMQEQLVHAGIRFRPQD
ncbi:MAG: RluA family pseudouridine synthase [Chlamydiia bacterium]